MTETHDTAQVGAAGRSVRSQAIRRFVWWSLTAFVLCTVGGVVAVRAVASEIAERDAGVRGATFAQNVAAPLVNRHVRAGDPAQTQLLDTIMRNRMRDGSIVRIKIWSGDGTIIWSDAPDLLGETFKLDSEEAGLFGTDRVSSTVSDLDKDENVDERAFGELLEVYAGAHDAEGLPILVESYWGTERILRDELVIFTRIGPLIVGVLAIFMLAVLPLAFSLARRVDRAQAERASMLRHALDASDRERRRMSRQLHDGLIQDLTSLGFALPTVSNELPPEATAAREVLRSVQSGLQTDIHALRSILTELYPSDLARQGLAGAVGDLADAMRGQGLSVTVDVSDDIDFSPEAIQLAYRTIREGLRNVIKHADALSVDVVARFDGADVVVTVRDDGVGLGDSASDATHLGIRMLQDDAADIGGTVALGEADGGGALLSARFPRSFAWPWDSSGL